MREPNRALRHSRRGIALLMTLIFLALFASLAVGLAAATDMNAAVARNRYNNSQAAALAETGVQLVQKHVGGLYVPRTHGAADLHQAIGQQLRTALNSSSMVNAAGITWDSSAVTVPAITLARADNRSGTVNITIAAAGGVLDHTTVTITSTGQFANATRTATYNMTVQRGHTALDDFGVASKSSITMGGNADIRGANQADEGSILSATYSTANAIQGNGTPYISGDACVVNPNGHIAMGNGTVGGRELIGVEEPQWPQVDQDVFSPYATNTCTSGGQNITLSNVRIPPNTNPTFSGNVTILGVMYVQTPNKVTFTGNCTITGVIVCQTPTVDNLTANSVEFKGTVDSSPVENLPAGSQYDGLRDLTGSFLLAPGFSVSFGGNFGTINGCMVASKFSFSGTAGGTVKGGIVNLRDSSFSLRGTSPVIIDKQHAVEDPAGIIASYRLVCVSGSYVE